METNQVPKNSMENKETGCCPKFTPEPWDDQEFRFEDKLFAQTNTINFLHIPLNMGKAIMSAWGKIKEAGADSEDYLMLSYDPSLWKGEHLFPVTKEVPGLKSVRLTGTYLTKVFEGPYKEAKSWCKGMEDHVKSKGKTIKKLYFFYTTCPKCSKHYGKNYVVGFAEV